MDHHDQTGPARNLPPLPRRMEHLRRDARGYPVPWFVWWDDDGTPDFRIVAPGKIEEAIRFERCWVCGEQRGRNMAFVIGPMCAVNRTTSEPPCHLDCATFSAMACPFLTRPKMRRNETGEVYAESQGNVAGQAIRRNPGVALIWETRSYQLFAPPPPYNRGQGVLFQLGDPVAVHWYAHGRKATRAEVLESIETGLPVLREMCNQERTPELKRMAFRELDQRTEAAMALIPAA